jgi:hypothetical protein
MEYQVYSCENTTEVYEDRLYQCFGQFEDEGLTYTFTRRMDMPLQECFVGTTVGPAHYIMEAGAHCQRGKQPAEHGMVMTKELDPICDTVEDSHPAIELTTSPRPISPRVSLVHSTPETVDASTHNSHHSHNHQHHHSRPQVPVTTTRRSSSPSSHPPVRDSGQRALQPSFLLTVIIFLFLQLGH